LTVHSQLLELRFFIIRSSGGISTRRLAKFGLCQASTIIDILKPTSYLDFADSGGKATLSDTLSVASSLHIRQLGHLSFVAFSLGGGNERYGHA
jgi:hypothetical protein